MEVKWTDWKERVPVAADSASAWSDEYAQHIHQQTSPDKQ